MARNRGKMKQPTKQQLRDRIAELEYMLDYRSTIIANLHEELETVERHNEWLKANCKRATIAAYALLATLMVIVIIEFGF